MKKKLLSSLLAITLCLSLTACAADEGKKETASQDVVKEEQADKKQASNEEELATAMNYQVTEESNPEIKMSNQPISSFWFPEELLEWNAAEDKDLSYNVSTVPLAERVDKSKLEAVNDTQNTDTKVVALSIMNSSTSGNPSQGSNKFNANTFTYWQYIDMLVYWGGSSGEGLIVPPSADVTNGAHRNGVPVLGTIFFPMTQHGGKMEWLDTFLEKDEQGRFPLVAKLIEVANTYGFDGWFINQETQGTETEPLTAEHAALMQEFILQFKAEAGDSLHIMWYDSMTTEGKMDWQNALTDNNASFMMTEDKKNVADSMFLNFWWTGSSVKAESLEGQPQDVIDYVNEQNALADLELLKASNAKATELGIDPYSLFAGVDVQEKGIRTEIKWDLFADSTGKAFTSLGLYCPSWTYFSASSIEEFESNEQNLWVNTMGDPSNTDRPESISWTGISTYAVEKTVVNKVPFITNFSMGNGYSFFIDGEKISLGDWNNRSMTDVMPTYRYIINNEGKSKLTPTINFSEGYYGGNSLKLRGDIDKENGSTITLYSSDLTIDKDMIFTSALKADTQVQVTAVLTLDDGTVVEIPGSQQIENAWTVVGFDLKELEGKTVRKIGLKFTAAEVLEAIDIYLGNLSITKEEFNKETAVTEAKVDEVVFDDDAMYAGVRLSFTPGGEETPRHYEIYRINQDSSKSLLGVSASPNFFINALPRDGEVLKMEFEIVPVNQNYVRGTSAKTSMEWVDNSLPKANFKSGSTIAAPGQEVTFESTSSQNTTEYIWTFEGATPATSTDAAPVVTYSEEGTYKVSLTAKNDKGEDTKEVEGYVTITADATEGLVNLALNQPTEATAYVNDNEAPPFAVDGKYDTKWCATGTPPHEITIDLGEAKMVGAVGIAHAEAGNESPDMNTHKFTISVSEDGENFTDVAVNKNNKAANSVDTFPAVTARYVKLTVNKPTQGSDSAARIYEVEVFGLK